MARKMDCNHLKKIDHDYIIDTTDSGYLLRAVCDFYNSRIVYHVEESGNNIITIFHSAKAAINYYNQVALR